MVFIELENSMNEVLRMARMFAVWVLFLFGCTCITINNGNNHNGTDTTGYFAPESSLSGSVSGTIGETRKVYYIGHAQVDSGETLRVLAGTSILSDSHVDSATAATKKARLDVYGTLLLEGTAGDSVFLGNSMLNGNICSGWIGIFADKARISVGYSRFEPVVSRLEIGECQSFLHSSLVLIPIVPSFGNILVLDSSRIYRRFGGERGYPGKIGNVLSLIGNTFVFGPLAASYESTLLAPGGAGDSAYIAHNIFYSTTPEPSEAEYTGIWPGYGCKGVMLNNTFWIEIPFRFPSADLGGDVGHWEIKNNNVIQKRASSATETRSYIFPEGYDISYNNIWGLYKTGHYIAFSNVAGYTLLYHTQVNSNGDSCDTYFNISKDALFVDHTTFALQDSSPCVGAGEKGVDMGAVAFSKQ